MLRLLPILFSLGLFLELPPPAYTDSLWDANQDIYQEILRHPFLEGLADGTLSKQAFSFYMIQDAHYLRQFSRALSITASKAPRAEWATLLNSQAADTLSYEMTLHESVFAEYGISARQVAATEPSPQALAYTNFLVVTAYGRSFSESLAALLPCYWIYWEVGKELKKKGSANPAYQRWIDAYAAEDYGQSVREILAIVNEVAKTANPRELEVMGRYFRRSSRYEWMFWDSSYHRTGWPPPSRPRLPVR